MNQFPCMWVGELSRHGFSLIELIVVIAVIAIIAAIAVPQLSGFASYSRFNATHAGFRNITQSLELYFVDFGSYPPNAAHGERPPELEGYVSESVFATPPPMGLAWDWNGEGTGINRYGWNLSIHTTPSVDRTEMERIFDDGDAKTGLYRSQSHYLLWPMEP